MNMHHLINPNMGVLSLWNLIEINNLFPNMQAGIV
jgi:hypothetical protein